MRLCAKCGKENGEPRTSADSWCVDCGDFLGFPSSARALGREIRLVLDESKVAVLPGEEAVVVGRVHNRGDIVDRVTLTLEGDAAAWSSPEPVEVGVFPNESSILRLVLRPPRSCLVPAGLTSFRLRARSQADATVSDTADGTVDVGPFYGVNPSLVPMQSTGPSGAVHRLVLENTGNTVVEVPCTLTQPGDGLSFQLEWPSVRIAPGAKLEIPIRVSPREPLDGSSDRSHPFAVAVAVPGQDLITIHGVHIQEAEATAPTLVLAEPRLHAARVKRS